MSDADISMLDRCTGRQLKELLALGSIGDKMSPDSLLEIGDMEQLECLLTEMCTGAEQSAGALLHGICSPQTPVEALLAIKSAAKRLAMAAEAPAQKAAATLLYHLSVASALGRYGRNISSKDPAALRPLYNELAAQLSENDLAGIFERAVAQLTSASR